MSQPAPDDRVIYSRYQELGALAGVLVALEPQELLFFRVDDEGRPSRQGTPAVRVVKDTEVGLLRRVDELYALAPDPGAARVYWYTPRELDHPATRDFVASARQVGEAIAPPPDEGGGGDGPVCGGGCGPRG